MIKVGKDRLDLTLKPAALNLADQPCWNWSIPLPPRRPFREARIRIDSATSDQRPSSDLIELLADAMTAQQLLMASQSLSINQIAKANGRCRKQLTKLFTLSWLSPAMVEAIVGGTHSARLTRTRLLEVELPVDWSEQEALLGICG